jgi:hypothetical protein
LTTNKGHVTETMLVLLMHIWVGDPTEKIVAQAVNHVIYVILGYTKFNMEPQICVNLLYLIEIHLSNPIFGVPC